jgi:hypothetical protein
MLVSCLGWLSVVAFAGLIAVAGQVIGIIVDDLFHKMHLKFLTNDVGGVLVSGSFSVLWMLLLAEVGNLCLLEVSTLSSAFLITSSRFLIFDDAVHISMVGIKIGRPTISLRRVVVQVSVAEAPLTEFRGAAFFVVDPKCSLECRFIFTTNLCSYISLLTVGLGDYYIEADFIFLDDLFIFTFIFLAGTCYWLKHCSFS